MNHDQLTKLATAFKAHSLFHEFYATVNSETIVFTVALYDGDAAPGEPFYVKRFDITSQASTETIRDDANADRVEAVRLHFNDTVMRSEGLEALQDYVAGGSGKLDEHPVYGQQTFTSDLDELRVGANEWVMTRCTGQYFIGSDCYAV